MLSMTGYGYAELLSEDFLLTVEVKSYNNRYLDIVHTIPNSLSRFEQAIDAKIKRIASRGRVEVSVRLRQINVDLTLHVDEKALGEYRGAFDKIKKVAMLDHGPTLADYLGMEGILVSVRDTEVSRYEEPLLQLLDEALVGYLSSKRREGEATKSDLMRLVDILEKGVDQVDSHTLSLEQKLKGNLLDRFDEGRFLQEVATLLSKYSVNEEIVRLRTHIASFKDLLESDEPVGKKLDFLSQEMNREINTIGSKSIIVQINQQVVEMKDSLENIREQVRNIE
jgi:uncharacterized protein (TIGR00255 family)